MASDVGRAVGAETVLVTVRDHARIDAFKRFNSKDKASFRMHCKEKRKDMFVGIASSL